MYTTLWQFIVNTVEMRFNKKRYTTTEPIGLLIFFYFLHKEDLMQQKLQRNEKNNFKTVLQGSFK